MHEWQDTLGDAGCELADLVTEQVRPQLVREARAHDHDPLVRAEERARSVMNRAVRMERTSAFARGGGERTERRKEVGGRRGGCCVAHGGLGAQDTMGRDGRTSPWPDRPDRG